MSTGSQESDTTQRAHTVPLPRRSSQEQDEGNFRAGEDSGVCELRPRHGGCRSFQNTQGALGCRSQLCFQAQWSGLPSWFPRAVKPQLPFLFLVESLAARSDPSHPGCRPGRLLFSPSEWRRPFHVSVFPGAFLIIRMQARSESQGGHRLEGWRKCPCQPGLT